LEGECIAGPTAASRTAGFPGPDEPSGALYGHEGAIRNVLLAIAVRGSGTVIVYAALSHGARRRCRIYGVPFDHRFEVLLRGGSSGWVVYVGAICCSYTVDLVWSRPGVRFAGAVLVRDRTASSSAFCESLLVLLSDLVRD
jgi:hypothetical protein